MIEEKIYIVGADSRGQTFAVYVRFLYPNTKILAYLVDDPEENLICIDGVPVRKIAPESLLNTEVPAFLATRSVFHEKLRRELDHIGIKKIYPVDVKLDNTLRNQYVEAVYRIQGREFLKLKPDEAIQKNWGADCTHDCAVYVASSVSDRPLKHPYIRPSYEKIIQVGTALTDRRLPEAEAFDNLGDNISYKNRQYSELTALYWIWKHAEEDVIGLVHYRRHFLLPDFWLNWMEINKVDVILPVPLCVIPNLEENYKARHYACNWDYMMQYREACSREEADKMRKFFKTSLYSPCNMFIMRRRVLHEFCTWLFPILEATAERGGTYEDDYQNRYPGFLAERLLTYYFECHRNCYKIAYADKEFLDS